MNDMAGSMPVAVGAPGHRDDVRVVEQRQRRLEVAGIEPGVGVEQEHDAEPLDEPESADALLQGARLADVRGGLDDVDAMPAGQSTVLSVDASDTTWTFSGGTRAVMAARESSMTTSSLWAAMSTATSATVRILPPPEARVGPASPPLAAAWTTPVGAEGPVRRRASVPRQAPDPVQGAVHEPEESDRAPQGEVDAENEREHPPGRDHETASPDARRQAQSPGRAREARPGGQGFKPAWPRQRPSGSLPGGPAVRVQAGWPCQRPSEWLPGGPLAPPVRRAHAV